MASPWAQLEQQANTAQNLQPPPGVFAPVDMPSAPPEMGAPAPPPVARIPTSGENQLQDTQNQLQKVHWQQNNPWGTAENHPGNLGKVAHVFSNIGNIAGDIFAPDVMAHIPGTQMNREVKENELTHRLEQENQEQSLENERAATQAKTEADTAAEPGKVASEEKLQGEQGKNLESETAAREQATAQGPSLIQGHAHAVNQAIKNGRDPASDPLVQQYEDAITRLQKDPAAQGVGKVTDISTPNGIHTMGYDSKTGKFDIDNGPTGYKPPVTRIETPNQQREGRNDLLKAYQPSLDSAERMNVMTDAYEKAVKNHDQQAMLNLLANHLGMTMGLQKGARITRDLYHEAAESTPWLQKIGAKFDDNGYLSGVTLNPNQMRQMVNLAQERYAEDTGKSRSTAKYLGGTDDGPERKPGKATMNYYIGLAKGDPNKAKELAGQDGWSVNGSAATK